MKNIPLYGHICIDQNSIDGIQQEKRPGSPAFFCAQILQQLQTHPFIFSHRGKDYPTEWLSCPVFPENPTYESTLTYKNNYIKGNRTLVAHHLESATFPSNETILSTLLQTLDAVVICPIVNNIPVKTIEYLRQQTRKETFFMCLPQGFYRRFHANGEVYQDTWTDEQHMVPLFDCICLSEEDGDHIHDQAKQWSKQGPIVLVTQAHNGCSVYTEGDKKNFPAVHTNNVIDPVGAGDVFAAAFLFQYLRTRDPYQSAQFANSAGALSIQFTSRDITLTLDAIEKNILL